MGSRHSQGRTRMARPMKLQARSFFLSAQPHSNPGVRILTYDKRGATERHVDI